MIEAYALGKLHDPELDTHVATCTNCQERIAEARSWDTFLNRARQWMLRRPRGSRIRPGEREIVISILKTALEMERLEKFKKAAVECYGQSISGAKKRDRV